MTILIFLDFDGVICDSQAECLVSSWQAYYTLHKQDTPDRVSLSLKTRFEQLRPFVRSGKDYVLMQELIELHAVVNDQKTFDAHRARAGVSLLSHYEALFYRARRKLMETERDYWLKLNPLYPCLKKKLKHWSISPCLFIISTKKSEYILEILNSNRIHLDPRRVLYTAGGKKTEIISELLDRMEADQALLIDDQIDHLLANRDPRIDTLLASWGYVKKEWLHGEWGITVLDQAELGRILEDRLDFCSQAGS